MTFDSDNGSSAHVDALTREVKASFRKLDQAVRTMDQGAPNTAGEDAQVRSSGSSSGGYSGAAVEGCAVWWSQA